VTRSDTRHICPLSWGVVPEPQIFLNYRRSNAEWRADRLYDALADEFGEEQVFKDTDTIAAGTEYALVIQQALTRTDVVVALIGPAWSDIRDAGGGRRLDDPSDLVRHELEVALERRVPILPVLVNEATMPVADELPERLRGLAAKQALTLNDATWRATVKGELLARVRELHEEMRARRREAAAIGVGGVFGPFRLQDPLVDDPASPRFRAEDTEAGHRVVLEVLARPEEADGRFDDTADALATIDDPHLVPILHGELDGRSYLVGTEPVGRPLPDALAIATVLPAARAVATVEAVAAALGVLRAAGVDVQLRAADVWLAPSGSQPAARLLPFGAFPGHEHPDYAAPERLRGKQFDERADVYALACLLFECLTGGPPYPGATTEAVITGHLNKPRPHLTDAPAALDAVLRRGLAKKPAERTTTPRLLITSARAALGGPPAPAATTPGPIVDQLVDAVRKLPAQGANARARMSTPGLRVGAALAALALAACSVAGAVWLGGVRDKQPGDPFVIDGPGVLSGLVGYVFLVALTGAIAGAATLLVGVVSARRRTPSWTDAFDVAAKWPAATVGGLTAVIVGGLLPLVAVASIVRYRRVPEQLLGDLWNYALGFSALGALFVLATYSATCWFALRQRVVHTSRAVADRQFPLFVGAVALVAGALAVAIGGVVAFGVAGAVIVVCVGCLVVEAFDRASPIGSYLGGVAITLAAGGGSVAAFALL
jgi:hypothetical protein